MLIDMRADGHLSLALVAFCFAACSSSSGRSPSGTGGPSATGGTVGTEGSGGVATGGATGSGGASSGGSAGRGGETVAGGTSGVGGGVGSGGREGSGGALGTGGGASGTGGVVNGGAGGSVPEVGTGGGAGSGGATGAGGSTSSGGAAFPFPLNIKGEHCILPTSYDNEKVRAAYEAWKDATITADGAGGYLRVRKPDSGSVIGSTVSEGIGYGMILAVYMDDQTVFDGLWKYEQSHLDGNGLMHWEIGPDNNITSGGTGAAIDGDEDMAWALVMADRQWGGKGTLDDTYADHAKQLIDLIWKHEVDEKRGYMLKPGDQWGDVDITNPSYFAPAYYRVFGQVTGKTSDWDKVITGNYDILEKSLNATSGNATNGLVPAWCNSAGTPVEAYGGAPKHFQNDSTRTPFRIGQDYCYFGEPRAKSYLDKITSFYVGVGVDNIVDGYQLDGTPKPERAVNGAQAASFVGPAGVGAMSGTEHQAFLDGAYAAVATLNLTAGTIYYQKSWTALSLLMMTGSLVDLTQVSPK